MSPPNTLHAAPTLDQIHAHLLEIDPTLRSHSRRPVTLPQERVALEQTNATLKRINSAFQTKAHALYQGLDQADLTQPAGQQLLTQLKTSLNQNLQILDETSTVDGQSRKTYLTFTAGISALEQETRLNVRDYLLSPADQQMLEDCSRVPSLRPGMYALTFDYQDQTVAFAGAFVLTRQASPTVDRLDAASSVGEVLLFTPSRGLEAFDSLQDLDQGLKSVMTHASGRAEFNRHLPVAYQHLDPIGIWPLGLQRIQDELLFEHAYQALLDKRERDINLALSLADSKQLNATQLKQRLDTAVRDALPDLTERLEFRAQQLLERDLFNALPDWYRSADIAKRTTLDQHLRRYNQARRAFIDLFGPAATPQALARHQWAELLADELDIHDLDPDQLHITTRRTVPHVGIYDQQRSLVELSLRGLHTGDSAPGSAFLEHSTLSYAGAPIKAEHAGLTAQSVIALLQDLQPRLDFATTQKAALATPYVKQAARDFFDQRLVALAYLATLKGHLSQADFELFEQLREKPRPQLCAQTVMLHGAQFIDVWLLREDDSNGQVKRLLLCTPNAPGTQEFFAFDTLHACQTHVIGWLDNKTRINGHTMRDYLLEQLPLRFRPKMRAFMQGISLRPDAKEHLEVTFGKPCSHADCLDALAAHRLAVQEDDYEQSSPAWYRATSATDRARLTTLGDDAEGALRTYNARPDAEANFPTFERYLHQTASLSLNKLLGRPQNDIDPDSVFAYSPKPLVGKPALPVSYTTLFRDGYEDGIGFLNEKFSASATFRGPPGVDLTPLTAQNVSRSVTGVWIGQRYTDEVRERLQSSTSAGYAERRNAVLAIQQLHLKSAALESHLQGHIASVDLAWLELAIDSLTKTDGTTRTTYKIHRLVIDGDWVLGNYLFSHADKPTLLYTPDAPDGVRFREARLFNYLLKKVDGMIDYWCTRMPQRSVPRVTTFLQNASKGLPEDINRTTPSPPRHDGISHITPLSDLRHEFYNMRLQRKIDDVHAATVNRTQMITGILWTCIEWVTAVATMPFPVLSLTLGGSLAFKDAMLALNAYHQNDKGGALDHYIGFLANFAGGLLFDVRPALKSALKAVRPMIRTGPRAVQSALISQLDTLNPEGMQRVLFDGQWLWAPQHPDALGRYLLYRLDPRSGQLHSTARLVNRNASGEWVRTGVVGGGRKKYEKLVADESSPMEAFDMAPEHAQHFRTLLDPKFKEHLQANLGEFGAAAQSTARVDSAHLRDAYTHKVAQLNQRADTFFQSLSAPAPKKPPPLLATNAAHRDILHTLFNRDKRLIIGAADRSVASKQLLIEQLPSLAEQGLKRVYIENLPRDLFHRKLKILNNQLPGDKAHALKQIADHLKWIDETVGLTEEAPFTYRKLLLETQRLNIAIDGMDGAVSYHLDNALAIGDAPRFMPRTSKLRNFYSHTALGHNLSINPNEPWIALVDSNRLGTHERVAGLADLQNTLALRVEDVAPGQPTGIRPDTASSGLSRGDYLLSIAATPVVPPTPVATLAPAAAVSHFAEFDMPHAFHRQIREMIPIHRSLDTRYSPSPPAKMHFSETRQRLANTAKAYFADFTPPARTPLAELPTHSEPAFFEHLYRQKSGLVIGESHLHKSAKQLLMDHMELLKKQGVETLYVEHLFTDLHQADLDTFFRTSKLPDDLQNYLTYMDEGQMPGYRGTYTLTNVIKKANKHGIRVRALDCTASYHVKGLNGDIGRNALFSYFANQVIKADQLARRPGKWVALMGNTHTDMYGGVPGIAQLQDAVSLHVRDTYPALAKRLRSGGWRSEGDASIIAMRSDYRMDVGNLTGPMPRRAPAPDRTRLLSAADFFIEHPSEFEVSLVHRSRSNEIIATPIQIDDKGQYFIERWDALKNERFLDLVILIEVLKAQPPRGVGLHPIT